MDQKRYRSTKRSLSANTMFLGVRSPEIWVAQYPPYTRALSKRASETKDATPTVALLTAFMCTVPTNVNEEFILPPAPNIHPISCLGDTRTFTAAVPDRCNFFQPLSCVLYQPTGSCARPRVFSNRDMLGNILLFGKRGPRIYDLTRVDDYMYFYLNPALCEWPKTPGC